MPTDLYNQNIYRNGRETVAEVRYNLTAPDSKEGGELILPPGNEFSQPDQIMNENRVMIAPIATLEPNYWKLDGSFVLPLPPDRTDDEVGWWSSYISDENGVLTEPFIIERVFDTAQTFNTLSIAFDSATNNYCTDFEVFFYDAYENLIYSEHITDNTLVTRNTEKAGIDILRVAIILYKTNNPHRYARIVEIDFGIVLIYTEREIKSINLIRETDPTGRTFPLPEFRMRILNNGLYDQLDSTTPAPYFQTRQRFEYRHGLILPDKSIEWIDCGIYFLTNWTVSDKTVEFVASSKTALLENATYFGSSFQEFTISQLANRIFPQVNIDISSPRIPGYFGNTDYRRAAAILSELSCCLVYEDRKNIVQFSDVLTKEIHPVLMWNYKLDGSWRLGEKPFSDVLFRDVEPVRRWNYKLDGSWRLGEKPFSTMTAAIDDLNYANVFKPPQVNLSGYYNAINLTEYTASPETRQISKTRHRAGDIAIYFDTPISGTPEYEITPGFTIKNIIWHTMYMTASLEGTGEAEITITGESITFTKSEVIYKAPWHTGRELDNAYPVDLPMMIRTENFEAFRDWFLKRKFKILAKRLNSDINWYQNPERELGDIVNVQLNNKGTDTNMIMIRNELIYGSSLKGETKVLSNAVMR